MNNTQPAYWKEDVLKSKQGNRYSDAPEWFMHWREQQMHLFLEKGFPTKRDEDWKYSHLDLITERRFSMASPILVNTELDLSPLRIDDVYTLVFIDSHFSPDLSDIDDFPSSMIITTIQEQLNNNDDFLKEHFQSQTKENTSSFEALNATLMTDGLFIRFPRNFILDKPIHLLYISTLESSDKMNHPRHIFIAEDNAQFTLFEEYVSLGGAFYFNNIVTTIEAGNNTNIHLYKLQRENVHGFHIANTHISQKKNSIVKSFYFSAGGKLGRDNLNYCLTEPHAECELNGFYCLTKSQYIDHHTRIDHLVSQGKSNQLYKGILDERSHGVFNGKIHVHSKAKKVKAHQSNQNLLLSTRTEIDTKPELEIYSDDVQCSHGATVGTLDENALFYLRSRGVKITEAKHLLTFAFANEIMEKITNGNIANTIKTHVLKHLSYNQFREGKA